MSQLRSTPKISEVMQPDGTSPVSVAVSDDAQHPTNLSQTDTIYYLGFDGSRGQAFLITYLRSSFLVSICPFRDISVREHSRILLLV